MFYRLTLDKREAEVQDGRPGRKVLQKYRQMEMITWARGYSGCGEKWSDSCIFCMCFDRIC